jgi:hypothetical protein
MLQRPSESHNDRKTVGYFSRELRSLLNALDYHTEPLYIGKKTPLRNKGYEWKVHVVLYEKPRGIGEHHVYRVHHASASRATFIAGIHDTAHQALMVLRPPSWQAPQPELKLEEDPQEEVPHQEVKP